MASSAAHGGQAAHASVKVLPHDGIGKWNRLPRWAVFSNLEFPSPKPSRPRLAGHHDPQVRVS